MCVALISSLQTDEAIRIVAGRIAAEQSAGVLYNVGQMLSNNCRAVNRPAVRWWLEAAKLGHVKAQRNLGWAHLGGRGLKKPNARKAVKFYQRAAKAGDAQAQQVLGIMLPEGASENWVSNAADNGMWEAVVNVGKACHTGNGVNQDMQQAVELMSHAATVGNSAEAQWVLGKWYHDGQGVQKQSERAEGLWRKAATQGHREAQCWLGLMLLYKSEFIQPDDIIPVVLEETEAVHRLQELQEGFTWMMKAAEQDMPLAMAHIGVCYAYGHGVAKNPTISAQWYRRAGKKGISWAQNNLANAYR